LIRNWGIHKHIQYNILKHNNDIFSWENEPGEKWI
jgi:hypothetical protein